MSDLLSALHPVPDPTPDPTPNPTPGGKGAAAQRYDSDSIEVLEGLEPVRRRPGMYIGATDARALHHLAVEILDNAIDESIAGHATKVSMELLADGSLRITDNGRGIPITPHAKFPDRSTLEVLATVLHSGGKFSGQAYETSGGLHGVGLSVVNALSASMRIEVARDQRLVAMDFAEGIPQGGLQTLGTVRNRRGTSVTFRPDPKIFGEGLHFKARTLFGIARTKTFLTSGLTLHWHCAAPWHDKGSGESSGEGNSEAVPQEAQLTFPAGLADALPLYLGDLLEPDLPLFVGSADFPESSSGESQGRMDWAIAGLPSEAAEKAGVESFANTIHTPLGGTHEAGLRAGLTRALRNFGDMAGVKKAANLSPEDVMGGLFVLFSLFIPEPQFQSQTKEKLTSSEAGKRVEPLIKDYFDSWLAGQPQAAHAMLDAAIARLEERQRKRLDKEQARKTAGRKGRLPGKLADCSRSQAAGTELFIVEGDSAGGSAKQARRRETQAILPLRGKILNVANASSDKLLGNQELNNLTLALGSGMGKAFDLDKLRYERVIIMTDADVDGAHIASLLMTFFYREMRPLIEAGHLFLAAPPLYRLQQGGTTHYARDDAHKAALLKTEFAARGKVDISRFKGLGEMSPAQLRDTTMDPTRRTLLSVTLSQASEAEAKAEELRQLSTLVEDLMGKRPERRFAFIQSRANEAEVSV